MPALADGRDPAGVSVWGGAHLPLRLKPAEPEPKRSRLSLGVREALEQSQGGFLQPLEAKKSCLKQGGC